MQGHIHKRVHTCTNGQQTTRWYVVVSMSIVGWMDAVDNSGTAVSAPVVRLRWLAHGWSTTCTTVAT